MPRGDGTGPNGQGAGTGTGGRTGQRGSGKGRSGGSVAGPGGDCICPNCGEKITHKMGGACYEQQCPKCGTAMIRE